MSGKAKGLTEDAIALMSDNEWHKFAEILTKLGDKIMPERATRLYAQNGFVKGSRPLDEQIRMGRRRGVYLCLRHLVRAKLVTFRAASETPDKGKDPDFREYKISEKCIERIQKGGTLIIPKIKKKHMKLPPNVVRLLERIQEFEKLFSQTFKGSRDWHDVGQYCRTLRHYVISNASIPQKQFKSSLYYNKTRKQEPPSPETQPTNGAAPEEPSK